MTAGAPVGVAGRRFASEAERIRAKQAAAMVALTAPHSAPTADADAVAGAYQTDWMR